MENYRHNIAVNLTALRKKAKLTQSELANKLHYVDKAVSKWENEYTIPSLEAMAELAKFFNVTIDYLISDHSGNPIVDYNDEERVKKLTDKNKFIITLMSVAVVWLVAVILFTSLMSFFSYGLWMTFVWATPASFVVALVLNEVWGRKKFRVFLDSLLLWTALTAIYLECYLYGLNLWMLFLVGVPVEVGFILWSVMYTKEKKSK